jgi:tetratricopeptide (TPR) repeat protein
MSQIAFYAGWYDDHASGPFSRPTVEFMPGAFAYHLHSYSAATIHDAEKYWVGPLLAKGATATMGAVAEPYLGGTPDMGIFTARFIYYGFSFGEAACASQPVLSWQITVVGDPLYRPFGKNIERLQEQLERERSPLLAWCYLRLLNFNLVTGKPMPECVTFLEQLVLTKQSAVLTEKLGDLYLAQGKPSSAVHAYAQALALDATPQQRVRLLLTLGDKHTQLDQPMEAYEDYQKLLKECPDYPDKLGLYHKLVPLAVRLNKNGDAERFQAEIQRLTPPPPKS